MRGFVSDLYPDPSPPTQVGLQESGEKCIHHSTQRFCVAPENKDNAYRQAGHI